MKKHLNISPWVSLLLLSSTLSFAQPTNMPSATTQLAKRGSLEVVAEDHRALNFMLSDENYRRKNVDAGKIKIELEELLAIREFSQQPKSLANETSLERRFKNFYLDKAKLEATLLVAERRAREALAANPELLEQRVREIYAKTDAPSTRQALSADFQQMTFDLAARSFAENATRITTAIKRLDAGEDFGKVARELSDDTLVQENEGKLFNVSGANMELNLSRILFDTLKPGQHSAEPVVTRRGLHVIKLLEVHQPRKRAFEEVRDQLQARVLDETGKRGRDEILQTLGIQPATFNDVAIDALLTKIDQAAVERAKQLLRNNPQGVAPK